jgi:putative flippase GtrA
VEFDMNRRIDKPFVIHIASYLFWGLATTAVNVLVYYLVRTYAMASVTVATFIAWFLSVLFAFLTNRAFVFHAQKGPCMRQLTLFYGSRIFSGIVDVLLMALLVTLWHLPELLCKLGVNGVVIVLNYVMSLAFVFRSKEAQE